MGWRHRAEPTTLDKVLGGLEMAVGTAIAVGSMGPWFDKYRTPFTETLMLGLAGGIMAHGRSRFQHYEPEAEDDHAARYMHGKLSKHKSTIKDIAHTAAPYVDDYVSRAKTYARSLSDRIRSYFSPQYA